MVRRSLIAAVFCPALAFTSATAWAGPPQPNAPPQICVNNECVTSTASDTSPTGSSGATPATPATPSSGTTTIKWNPGQYMASEGTLYGTEPLSSFTSEMDDLNGYDNILGYRLFVSWGALEPQEGQYNFSVLDAVLNRLKTQYNKPKRLVIALMPGNFGGCAVGTNNYIPLYIQQNPAYGASPIAGSYGWWGYTQNGTVSGSCVAAIWRPAVMARLIALVQALGAHYDSDPYFEALMFQENSWIIGDAINANPQAPDYSDNTMTGLFQTLMQAATTAFPHTSVVMENTWLQSATNTQTLEQWMIGNRIAPGSADTVGQSAFTSYNVMPQIAWGLQAYMGIQVTGSTWTPVDMRSQAHAMMDIEPMDIAGTSFAAWGAPDGFHPLDIIAALNQTYKASHAFWTHLSGNEGIYPGTGTVSAMASWAAWSNLAPVINTTPLTNTSYPANYP